jgi:hypothetical protein
LLDHKLRWKRFFPWPKYVLILEDVIYNSLFLFFKVDICEQKLFKVGCKYLFNLIKFIEMDEDLKEKSKINLNVILRKMKSLNYENIKQ